MALLRSRGDNDARSKAAAELAGTAAAAAALNSESSTDAPKHKGIRIGDLLKQHGLATEEQIEEALAAQKQTGKKLGHALVDLGFVHERDLATVLADQLGLEVVDLRHQELDVDLVSLLPESLARSAHAIPVKRVGPRIEVV